MKFVKPFMNARTRKHTLAGFITPRETVFMIVIAAAKVSVPPPLEMHSWPPKEIVYINLRELRLPAAVRRSFRRVRLQRGSNDRHRDENRAISYLSAAPCSISESVSCGKRRCKPPLFLTHVCSLTAIRSRLLLIF